MVRELKGRTTVMDSRKELLSNIRLVAPALGKGDLLPALANLWFQNGSVLAYDDIVAISTACKLDIEGGLDGTKVPAILERSGKVDHKLTFTIFKQEVQIKVGRARLTSPIMEAGRVPFVMPEPEGPWLQFVDREQLAKALAHCLQFVGHDVQRPEWYGVVLEADQKELYIYTGDAQITVEALVALKEPAKFRIILPKKFCEQIVAHPHAHLEIHETYALLSSNKVRVWGRPMINDETPPLNQKDIVASAVAKTSTAAPYPEWFSDHDEMGGDLDDEDSDDATASPSVASQR